MVDTRHCGRTGTGASRRAGSEDGAEEEEAHADIVGTGSARAQRRFDMSYAVNSPGQEEVQRIAPENFADLLGTIPGIQVEATGGEVQNITRVRGIPTDRGDLIFQQDGLPLYNEIDGIFFMLAQEAADCKIDVLADRTGLHRVDPIEARVAQRELRPAARLSASRNRDVVGDGHRIRFVNVGLQHAGDSDGWLLSAKGG